MLTFIMGKTCSGKTRIVEELCKKYGYHKLVTYTTRPMRKAERDGVGLPLHFSQRIYGQNQHEIFCRI